MSLRNRFDKVQSEKKNKPRLLATFTKDNPVHIIPHETTSRKIQPIEYIIEPEDNEHEKMRWKKLYDEYISEYAGWSKYLDPAKCSPEEVNELVDIALQRLEARGSAA